MEQRVEYDIGLHQAIAHCETLEEAKQELALLLESLDSGVLAAFQEYMRKRSESRVTYIEKDEISEFVRGKYWGEYRLGIESGRLLRTFLDALVGYIRDVERKEVTTHGQ